MSFSTLFDVLNIEATDKAAAAWRFRSVIWSDDFFNDLIHDMVFEQDVIINCIYITARIAPTDPTVNDALVVGILKNGVEQDTGELQRDSNTSKKFVSSISYLGRLSTPTPDKMRIKINRVGGGKPGAGLYVALRSPLI